MDALIGRILDIHQTRWMQTHQAHFRTARRFQPKNAPKAFGGRDPLGELAVRSPDLLDLRSGQGQGKEEGGKDGGYTAEGRGQRKEGKGRREKGWKRVWGEWMEAEISQRQSRRCTQNASQKSSGDKNQEVGGQRILRRRLRLTSLIAKCHHCPLWNQQPLARLQSCSEQCQLSHARWILSPHGCWNVWHLTSHQWSVCHLCNLSIETREFPTQLKHSSQRSPSPPS